MTMLLIITHTTRLSETYPLTASLAVLATPGEGLHPFPCAMRWGTLWRHAKRVAPRRGAKVGCVIAERSGTLVPFILSSSRSSRKQGGGSRPTPKLSNVVASSTPHNDTHIPPPLALRTTLTTTATQHPTNNTQQVVMP